MPDEYNDNERLLKEISKHNELEKERIKLTKKTISNFEDQKRIEKEHLNLVDEHQKYWHNQIKKTNENDKERYESLKKRLEKEEKIRNKILNHIKQLDEEIKIQKEHLH